MLVFVADFVPSFNNIIEKIRKYYKKTLGDIELDPSNQSVTVPADEFYLELELQDIDDTQFKVRSIYSYKDLFEGICDKTHRFCLYAPAGCWKTVLCQVVAFCWTKDYTLADKFDLVLLLKLRGHSLGDDVVQMIIKQVPELQLSPEKEEDVGELLKNHGDKILFVLDGFDEMVEPKNIPDREQKYTVEALLLDRLKHILVSTRPTDLDKLKHYAGPCMKIRIIGLSEVQAYCFIREYCKVRGITSMDPSTAIEHVIMPQLKKKQMSTLSKVPQQLQLLCDYMRNNIEIPASLTCLYDHLYNTFRESFLNKIKFYPAVDESIKQELRSNKIHERLLNQLELLALCGFVEGRLIYSQEIYSAIIDQRFVFVFAKMGTVYLEQCIGGSGNMLGFRHKSY